MTTESRGLPKRPMAPRQSSTRASARSSIPSALVVGSGNATYSTSALVSHEHEINPSAVAPKVSRPKNAKMAAKSIGGKTKAPKMRASSRLSCWGINPNCSQLVMSDPTPKAKKARGKGLARGLSIIRVASSTHRCEPSCVRSSPLSKDRLKPHGASVERRDDIHQTFLDLGCALICWRYVERLC
jgi:hypothetical protein